MKTKSKGKTKTAVTEIQKAASQWFALLTSGTASDADYAAWQAWRNEHAAHEEAWQQIETINVRFSLSGLSPALGMQILDHPVSRPRRRAVAQLLLVMVIAAASLLGYQQLTPWHDDYQTAVGEQRELMLEDGSRLTLNSDSAVDVVFSEDARRIILQQGEILVETGHEDNRAYRPLIAETVHGQVTALGTRFNLYQAGDKTRVSLYEGQLDILTRDGQQLRLKTGQETTFDTGNILAPEPFTSATPYWISGMLVADNMPLLEFIDEVARYRPGYLGADANLAGLRISGAFPLTNTDAILQSLATTLPVETRTFTRYWVKLQARTATDIPPGTGR